MSNNPRPRRIKAEANETKADETMDNQGDEALNEASPTDDITSSKEPAQAEELKSESIPAEKEVAALADKAPESAEPEAPIMEVVKPLALIAEEPAVEVVETLAVDAEEPLAEVFTPSDSQIAACISRFEGYSPEYLSRFCE